MPMYRFSHKSRLSRALACDYLQSFPFLPLVCWQNTNYLSMSLCVCVLGMPMVWYASHWVGHAMFLPMGLLGGLIPYLSTYGHAEKHG